jgi:hypothetical protein
MGERSGMTPEGLDVSSLTAVGAGMVIGTFYRWLSVA